MRSLATGSNACCSPADACSTGLWQVQSSAVQAAIDQQKTLAATLDSPETLPKHARPTPTSDRAQEHADPGSTPEQSRRAAAGAARSMAPTKTRAAPRSSRAKSSMAKSRSHKEGAVRNWWEPQPSAEGQQAGIADEGGALETRCTCAQSAQGSAASGPHAADCTQAWTVPLPDSREVIGTVLHPCYSVGYAGVRRSGCEHIVCSAQQPCRPQVLVVWELGLRLWQGIRSATVVPNSPPQRGEVGLQSVQSGRAWQRPLRDGSGC